MYAVIPIKVLLSKHLSPTSKILYGYIVFLSGRTGKCKFTLHHFAVTFGIQHYLVKVSLNELAKNDFIWRVGDEISLLKPNKEDDKQLEVDFGIANEITRRWNDIFKRELPNGVKNTPALTAVISDAMSSYSEDELVLSVERWKAYTDADPWWSDSKNIHHRSNIFKFFQKIERIDQALNFKGGTNIVQPEKEAEDSGLLN